MTITTKIKTILSAMVDDVNCALKSYQYNDKPTANVTLDKGMESPTALFMQLTDWTVDLSGGTAKETTEINVSFLISEKQLDATADKQETAIDTAWGIAKDFIGRVLATNGIVPTGDTIDVKSVFLRSDSARTGVNVSMTLTTKQGYCII